MNKEEPIKNNQWKEELKILRASSKSYKEGSLDTLNMIMDASFYSRLSLSINLIFFHKKIKEYIKHIKEIEEIEE